MIKLRNNKFQIVMEVISAVILVCIFLLLILRWDGLPDKIPGHYNAAGEIDRWGNKSELLMLPITGAVLYLLLTVIGLIPSIWNVPVGTTEEKQNKVYGSAKSMMLLLKAEMLGCFFYLSYCQIEAKVLSPLFLPIVLAAVFGTLVYFIIRMYKVAK